MVHKNGYVLEKMIQMLDFLGDDIYFHIDKKCKDFNLTKYKKLVKSSKIYVVDNPVNVTWGSYSQILAELRLLKKARKNGEYQYYHLLSGQDLVLKTPKQLHKYMDQYFGKIFIRSKVITKENNKWVYNRASVDHIFVNRKKLKNRFCRKVLGLLDKTYTFIQIKLLKRDLVISKGIQLSYGGNWFSLPEYAVDTILNNTAKIEKYFRKSENADEIFVQSILREEGLKTVDNDLRLVDWSRGSNAHPYVFKEEDYNEIMKSGKLYARKFDESIDKKIIDQIFNNIMQARYDNE